MKKIILTVLSLLLVCVIISCSSTNKSSNNSSNNQMISLKDDFYEAVNYDVLNSWQIPEDSFATSYIYQINDKNTELLNQLVTSVYESNPDKTLRDEYNIAAFYETINDNASRNAKGYGLLNDYITKIDSAANVNELLKTAMECNLIYSCYPLLVFLKDINITDSTKYTYYLSINIGLEKEKWSSTNTLYSDAYINYLKQILIINGTASADAESIVNSVTTAMKDIASVSLNVEEIGNPANLNNPRTLTEISAVLNNALTVEDLKTLLGVTDENSQVIVLDIKAFEKAATYINDDNLELLKNYFKLNIYETFARYTTQEQENAYIEYYKTINGIKEYSVEKFRNVTIHDMIKYELGKKYMEKYFSEEIKQDVLKMIDNIKAVYENRINNLTWLNAETKTKAVNKLRAMKAYVGVDDTELWPQDLYNYMLQNISEGGSFINNILLMEQAANNYYKNELLNGNTVANIMKNAPQVVNAYYSMTQNAFKILPGILQSPIYSLNSSDEEKYGGVGVIIAHEITHAFDSNGALYDELGNYGTSWWLPEDMEQYKLLQQKTIEYYNGYEINGIQVNGTLTLSENIADLGAVACITEYALNNNLNLQNLYTTYAKIWATKMLPERQEMLLLTDVHAPAKVRANAVLSATDEFYTVFDIKETDGMYKAKEVRPVIW